MKWPTGEPGGDMIDQAATITKIKVITKETKVLNSETVWKQKK